jgi:hypothetical protein
VALTLVARAEDHLIRDIGGAHGQTPGVLIAAGLEVLGEPQDHVDIRVDIEESLFHRPVARVERSPVAVREQGVPDQGLFALTGGLQMLGPPAKIVVEI